MNSFLNCIKIGIFFLGTIGTVTAFADVWQTRTNVKWAGTSLASSLSRFAETQKIGLLIDRRIDPQIPLHFESTNQSLKHVLQSLAESLDLACVFFDSTVYLGTKNATEILPELLAAKRRELEKLPNRRAILFRQKLSFKIPFLSEPKEILQNLATQHSFHWKNPELLPHDLWDEKTLTGLSLDELLTLLLIGFDLTFEIEENGKTLIFVPLQNSSKQTSTVTAETHSTESVESVAKNNETSFADSNSSTDFRSKIPLAQRRFTLKVEEKPLNKLLQLLAERLDLILELDEKSLAGKGVALESRISFDVKNATAAQLFQAILRPLKLNFRINEKSIRVW
jgi:hypothetical protein